MPEPVGQKGSAEFTVLLRADGRVAEARFESGDEPLAGASSGLLKTVYAVRFPDGADMRLPVRARVVCSTDPDDCRTAIIVPRTVKSRKP